MTMTIEEVMNWHRNQARAIRSSENVVSHPEFCERQARKHSDLADAIAFHLSQPQPVAQGEEDKINGEAVAQITRNGDDFNVSWLIEGGIDAMIEGETLYILGMKCPDYGAVELYTTPTIPTGYRLVPVEPTEAMIADGCSMHICEQGDSWYKAWPLSECDCEAIYKAMLKAAPTGGG